MDFVYGSNMDLLASLLGVFRLVVRVVPHLFHGHAQGCVHSVEKELEMVAYRGLGTSSLLFRRIAG